MLADSKLLETLLLKIDAHVQSRCHSRLIDHADEIARLFAEVSLDAMQS